MKTDVDLKQDVIDELAWDMGVNETHIGVRVDHGVVTLSGHPASYAEKLAAERAALRVAGAKAVTVELDVQVPGPFKRTDEDIAAAAFTALSLNSMVPHDAVKIMVEDGIITLSGEVDGDVRRCAAVRAVRFLMGVREVRNHISLQLVAPPKDIKSKITAALHRQAQVDAQHIEVQVDGHLVTLKGKVSSLPERQAAVRAAGAAPGVDEVIDHLEIAV